MPENERQVRLLVGVPDKMLPKVWKRVLENAGPTGGVSGALIKRTVKELGVQKSRRNIPVRKEPAREDWRRRIEPLLKEAELRLRKQDREGVSEVSAVNLARHGISNLDATEITLRLLAGME